MQEKSGESRLSIDLPTGMEIVTSNSITLEAGINSPAEVTIDGHGRILTIDAGYAQGKLLTVGKGVTLTLQNLTLLGSRENNAPLVEVRRGGTLILGTGAVLMGNKSSGDAGGVLISTGEFIMNDGIIKENTVNKSSYSYYTAIGGGVYNMGTFTMNNGSIQRNTVSGPYNYGNLGGGVFNGDHGIFNMRGGIIGGLPSAYLMPTTSP
jgi:hypothetical protein